MLLAQLIRLARSLALARAGNSIAANIAMMAMTTKSSIRVKPRTEVFANAGMPDTGVMRLCLNPNKNIGLTYNSENAQRNPTNNNLKSSPMTASCRECSRQDQKTGFLRFFHQRSCFAQEDAGEYPVKPKAWFPGACWQSIEPSFDSLPPQGQFGTGLANLSQLIVCHRQQDLKGCVTNIVRVFVTKRFLMPILHAGVVAPAIFHQRQGK